MKKLLTGFGAFIGAMLAGLIAFGAIPSIPNTPNFSDPAQIVATLNALINTLNGQPSPITNNLPPSVVMAPGVFCSNTAGATPQTCNGQRGLVSFTGVTAAGNANATAQVINNSFVFSGSVCGVSINSYNGAAGAGPTVRTVIPADGTLTIIVTNATATSTGSSTFGFGFACVN